MNHLLRAFKWFPLVTRILGSITIFLGIAVIFGKLTDSSTLIQIQSTWVSLPFRTGLGLFLCGTGLLALTWNRTSLVIPRAGIVAVLGGLSFAVYLFYGDFGIDKFLGEHLITATTSRFGRISPGNSLSFFLAGPALFWLTKARLHKFSSLTGGLLGVVVGAVGFGILFEYFVGADTSFYWAAFNSGGIHGNRISDNRDGNPGLVLA